MNPDTQNPAPRPLPPEAVAALARIAGDKYNQCGGTEMYALWECFGYALDDVQRQFQRTDATSAETMYSRVLHLASLMRVILLLESPTIGARTTPPTADKFVTRTDPPDAK